MIKLPFGFLVLGLAVCGVESTHASTLYKCKDAKGVISYQQTPCASAEKAQGTVTYRPVAPSPRNSWSAQAGGRVQQDPRSDTSYLAESAPAQRGSSPAASYQCDDGRRQWVQR